jgi:acylphosphatase
MTGVAPPRVRARLLISGRVQGVGLRLFVQREAHRLGLAGFVRNLRDGRVEAEAEGPRAAVDEFIQIVRAGPPGARVARVDVAWEPPRAGARGEPRYVILADA